MFNNKTLYLWSKLKHWIDLPTIEKINDETKSCDFWVFNPTVAMDLFK